MSRDSREAYAYGFTFDSPGFLFDIYDHVTQFVRKSTFDPLQTDRDFTFDPVRTNDYLLYIQKCVSPRSATVTRPRQVTLQ